jgi:hypothetical protein
MVSLGLVGEVFEVRTQVDRDLTTVSRVDRWLGLIKILGRHKNLHLGREDDIVKIVQVEGAKCIITWGPTGAKGRPNQAGMGLGRSAQAGRPGPLLWLVRPPFLAPEGFSTLKPWGRRHSQRREPFTPGGYPQARERGGRSPEVDRPSRRKHPQVEKKEDIVGSVTMINGAMSSTLMG